MAPGRGRGRRNLEFVVAADGHGPGHELGQGLDRHVEVIGAQHEGQAVFGVQIGQDFGVERAVDDAVPGDGVAHVERDQLHPADREPEHVGRPKAGRSALAREQVAHVARPVDDGDVVSICEQVLEVGGEIGRIERKHYAFSPVPSGDGRCRLTGF